MQPSPDVLAELQLWDQRLKINPRNPQAYVRRGMVRFKLAQIQASIADFDQAEALQPALTPYLWQRGLSYYYAEQFEAGARQFELDLQVNYQDVEETVWRFLCLARSQGLAAARTSLIPVKTDSRPIMARIYRLFAGNCSPEDVLLGGQQEGSRGAFYANLYVGLFYEAAHQETLARPYLVKAAEEYCLDDYMWHLARVHRYLRGWF
uniref:Uncharacterized protein n=1 Tax=Cyanothece sp. (strain PCC 7425 / ATCC 29141) TaxID=395961 RepID=B8HRQ9_CYAP4